MVITPWPFLLTVVNKKWLSDDINIVLDGCIKNRLN